MARGVNKVFLLGNLGQDPMFKEFQNGGGVTSFSMGTTSKWLGSDGQQKQATEWHNVSCYGKLAEIATKFLKKGSKVHVEGKIETRKWQDNQGNDRYTTVIIASDINILSEFKSQNEGNVQAPMPDEWETNSSGFDDDGDLPF